MQLREGCVVAALQLRCSSVGAATLLRGGGVAAVQGWCGGGVGVCGGAALVFHLRWGVGRRESWLLLCGA